jgi:hypothetical protein
VCGKKDCWTTGKRRTRYRDRKLARASVKSVVLRATKAGARIAAQAAGERLGAPATPIDDLPVTVQLVDADGGCWSARFSTPKKNDERRLKAKSD